MTMPADARDVTGPGAAGTRTEPSAPVLGEWIWLYPLAYGAHLADELWFGPGFPAWISARTGVAVSVQQFGSLNAALFVGMLVLVVLARWWWPPLILVLAGVVTVNGLLHLGASIATGTVSPGLATGLLVWLPLGVGTIRWGRGRFDRAVFWGSLASGLLLHAAITATLLL